MTPEKLTKMANQIAAFFNTQPREDAAEKTAAHLMDFWSPEMRSALKAHAEADGHGLDPAARDAAHKL